MDDQERTKEQLIEELAELRRSLDALMNNLPEGVIVVDSPDVKVRLASQDACEMIGVSREEFIGIIGEQHFRYYQPLLPNGETSSIERMPLARAVFEGEVIRNEEWLLQVRDGNKVPILCHAGPILDQQGRITGAVLSWQDITARKRGEEALRKARDELERRVEERTVELTRTNEQLRCEVGERRVAESALRESEERFRVTFDEAPVGMMISTEEGEIVRANRALCRMSGYAQDELIGRHLRDLTHPEDRQLSVPWVERLLANEISSFTLEKRYLRKNGGSFWVVTTTATVQGSDDKPAFVLVVVEDITQQKMARDAIERERRSLMHMLRASDHERELIAYDIHDGLAQELAGALMQFEIYDRFKDTKPDEAKLAYATGMILLRQGHAESRRLVSGVRPPALDESGVVGAIAHLVYDPAFEQGPKVTLRSRVAFTRLTPLVENVIYRIVQEGLTNARVHSKSAKIHVSLIQQDNLLRIKIRDWGVGFASKSVHENRFGLRGIRERARLLGGTCRIRSKLGSGTSVVVELQVTVRQ